MGRGSDHAGRHNSGLNGSPRRDPSTRTVTQPAYFPVLQPVTVPISGSRNPIAWSIPSASADRRTRIPFLSFILFPLVAPSRGCVGWGGYSFSVAAAAPDWITSVPMTHPAVVNTPGGIRYTQGAHPPYYHERLQTTTGSLAPLYGCSADLDPWTPRSGCMSTIRPLHAASRCRRPLRMLALLPIYDDSFSCFVVPVGLWGDSESQASRTLGHALTSTGRP